MLRVIEVKQILFDTCNEFLYINQYLGNPPSPLKKKKKTLPPSPPQKKKKQKKRWYKVFEILGHLL